ncbi:hypothetical protein [Streptomyces sp. NPDC093094]|uniref:hypothetical protein n=1 Tax=Streptomyces sp. NPDC093094 TaxID=3366026 RepID=UPI003811343F
MLPDPALAGWRAAASDGGTGHGALPETGSADETAVLPGMGRPLPRRDRGNTGGGAGPSGAGRPRDAFGAGPADGAGARGGTGRHAAGRAPRPGAAGGFDRPAAGYGPGAGAFPPPASSAPSAPSASRPGHGGDTRRPFGGTGRPAPGTGNADATAVFGAPGRPVPGAGDADATTVLPSAGHPNAGRTTAFPAATTPPRDPWAETGESAGDPFGTDAPASARRQEHDPHEVTVQLDAVQLGDLTLRAAAKAAPGTQEAADGPVFVDETGRRSRRWRRLGIAVGLACAVYAVVIVATLLSGSSDAPWLPVPGEKDEKPAGQVDSPLQPTESVDPSGTGTSAPPEADPTTTEGTAPAPGTTSGGTGSTATAEEPGVTADPQPTATRRTADPQPGGGTTQSDPEPTETATVPDPGPTTPTTEPTTPEPPVETGGGDGGGTDTTLSGPLDTDPQAGEPTTLAAPLSARPSPEYNL